MLRNWSIIDEIWITLILTDGAMLYLWAAFQYL